MNTEETLLAYSEWLDGQHVMLDPGHALEEGHDSRTHQDLVEGFIAQWSGKPLASDMHIELDVTNAYPRGLVDGYEKALTDVLEDLAEYADPADDADHAAILRDYGTQLRERLVSHPAATDPSEGGGGRG